MFGSNNIHVPVPSLVQLIAKELSHPFYIFQLFSIVIWFFDEYEGKVYNTIYSLYIVYAACVLFIGAVVAIVNAGQTRKNRLQLHRMAAYSGRIRIVRSSEVLEVDSADLVPGDVIEILPGMYLPCGI
jgi:cation-transporting ATPase 13A3/4/5